MAQIAVFDSGLGSLSVVRALRAASGHDTTYFADSAAFPYGSKGPAELGQIILDTIGMLRSRFAPDLTVVASNTPSLMLDLDMPGVICTRPPAAEAARLTRTGTVGVLATTSAITSGALGRFLGSGRHAARYVQIDGSALVGMVESGAFLSDPASCRQEIRKSVLPAVSGNGIDTLVLASTHLPFLAGLLGEELPGVRLVDPAASVAEEAVRRLGRTPGPGSLRVFTSGDPGEFGARLARLGVDVPVGLLCR